MISSGEVLILVQHGLQSGMQYYFSHFNLANTLLFFSGLGTATPRSTSKFSFCSCHVQLFTLESYYSYDISSAPWLQDDTSTAQFLQRVGWMVEALVIDPFDSNHW
jgi:hypothetical protein